MRSLDGIEKTYPFLLNERKKKHEPSPPSPNSSSSLTNPVLPRSRRSSSSSLITTVPFLPPSRIEINPSSSSLPTVPPARSLVLFTFAASIAACVGIEGVESSTERLYFARVMESNSEDEEGAPGRVGVDALSSER